MRAKELIAILQINPDAIVKIGYEEIVVYSELTTGSEDRIDDIETVIKDSDGCFIISMEAYLIGEKLWP